MPRMCCQRNEKPMTSIKTLSIVLNGCIVQIEGDKVRFKRYESDYGTGISIEDFRLVAEFVDCNRKYLEEEDREDQECETLEALGI